MTSPLLKKPPVVWLVRFHLNGILRGQQFIYGSPNGFLACECAILLADLWASRHPYDITFEQLPAWQHN